MRYITLLTATATPYGPPPGELMAAIAQLVQKATEAGALLDFGGLAPSAAGARIELTAGDIRVLDGPFTEAKELVSYAMSCGLTRASSRCGCGRWRPSSAIRAGSRSSMTTSARSGPGSRSAARSSARSIGLGNWCSAICGNRGS
jgi:hypothetical protein